MKDLTIWGSKAVASAPSPRSQVATSGPVSGAMVIHTDGTEPLHPLAETAIKRLIAAPAGSAQSNDDRMYELMNYREACSGKPLCLVVYTLNQLRRFNPRNPFKPSPQDVFEHIATAERKFKLRVKNWFFRDAQEWGVSTEGRNKGMELVKPSFGCEWGPEPLAEGCFVSRDLVIQWLRAELEQLATLDDEGALGRHPIAHSEDIGARIPAECWPEGLQARIAESQRRRAADEAAARAQVDYERGLSEDEHKARWWVLDTMRYHGMGGSERPSEEEIRRLTQCRVEREADRNRREEKHGIRIEGRSTTH
jgi:hypothetical protein